MSKLILGTCGTCRWFRPVGLEKTMCCTVNPPTVAFVPIPMELPHGPRQLQVQQITAYPRPEANFPACKEHMPKTAQ